MDVDSERKELKFSLFAKFRNMESADPALVVEEIRTIAASGNGFAQKIINSYDGDKDIAILGSGIFGSNEKYMLNINENGTKDTEHTKMWGLWNEKNAKDNS